MLLLCHCVACLNCSYSCVLRGSVQLDCDAENLCQIFGEVLLPM